MPVYRSRSARLLLWDFERGSRAYDLLCAFLFLVLVLAPGSWWRDPLRERVAKPGAGEWGEAAAAR